MNRWIGLGRVLSTQVAERASDLGLNTAGDAVEPEHAHPDRVLYKPSPWRVLPRALNYVGVSDRDTFVDFGCGKGRALHQAAKRPFRRVIGVEISPVLADIARTGLARRRYQHRCKNIEIVVTDAAQFSVPDDLTVGYFFDPFAGETLDAVLGNIAASIDRNPRRIRLIYFYPRASDQFLASGRFRLIAEQKRGHLSRAVIFESC